MPERNTRWQVGRRRRQSRNRTAEFVIAAARLYNKVNAGSSAHAHISSGPNGNGTCVAVYVALNFVTPVRKGRTTSGEGLCDAHLATR